MITILGIRYMNDKEAAAQFGFSQSWFEKRRSEKKPPSYIKLNGKILYEVEKTEKWFKENMLKVDYI